MATTENQAYHYLQQRIRPIPQPEQFCSILAATTQQKANKGKHNSLASAQQPPLNVQIVRADQLHPWDNAASGGVNHHQLPFGLAAASAALSAPANPSNNQMVISLQEQDGGERAGRKSGRKSLEMWLSRGGRRKKAGSDSG